MINRIRAALIDEEAVDDLENEPTIDPAEVIDLPPVPDCGDQPDVPPEAA